MQKVKTERKEKPKKKKTCSEHVRDSSLSSFRGYGRGSLVSLIAEQGIGYGQFLVLLRSHSQGTNSNQVFVSVTLCICDFKFQSRIHGLSLASLNFKVNNIYIFKNASTGVEYRTGLTQLFFYILSACFSLWKVGGAIYTFMEKTLFYDFIIIIFLLFLSSKCGSKYYTFYNFKSLVVGISHQLFLLTF